MDEKTRQERAARFQQTIDTHRGILFKVARTYCPDETERQDLMQEMMLQIWQSFDRYDTRFAITTWLYRIALNTAISFFRKKLRRPATAPLTEQTAQIADPQPADKQLQLQLLEQFIQELNELDKALILLYLEEKSHAEIAEILGISPTNASTKTARIKEKLKKRFASLQTS